MQIFKIYLPLATRFHLRGIVAMCYYNIRASEKKLDTKDDILIIESEQERVKMNVYEWLENPDVREYLEGIHYEFTLPEAFYVIRENEQRAL